MKKFLTIIAGYSISLMPTLALAIATLPGDGSTTLSGGGARNFSSLVGIVVGMVKSLVPLVIALSLLYFSWGLFQLIKSSNEGSREEAVKMMTFGIIALFVMVGVWGLVNVLTSTFFSGTLVVPQLR